MKSSSNPRATWLLFCRERVLKRRLDWTCVCWPRKVEAEFSLASPGHVYNLAVDGLLLGAQFHLEAWSRRRLEGDVRDSHVPLFVGSFEHQGGLSGDFTIQPREDGELMTLGLYGTPPSIHVVKVDTAHQVSALEAQGIPDLDVRFENFHDGWHKPSLAKDELPAKPGWRYYAGRCITKANFPDDSPPMVPLLAAMTVAYDQLLIRHYLTST